MPDRSYRGGMPNPSWLDHFYAHDTLTIISVAWVLNGLLSLAEALLPGFLTSSSIAVFPAAPLAISGLAHLLAGVLTFWGIYTKHKRIDVVWVIRKLAYTLIIIGAGIYVYYVIKRVPLEVLAIILGFGNILIGISGLIAITKADNITREIMREQGYDA